MGTPALPSIATHEAHNRRMAGAARQRAIARLVCQSRGCVEGLGFLEFDPDATVPTLRIAIHAPWAFEPSDDAQVLHRVRLRGATDRTSDAVYIGLPTMRQGQRVEFVCRHGHESRFGPGHLAGRLRAVLP